MPPYITYTLSLHTHVRVRMHAALHHLHTVSPPTYARTHACRLTSLGHCLSTHIGTYACTCLHACTHGWADGQIYEQPHTLYSNLCTHANRPMSAGSRQQGQCNTGPMPCCNTLHMHTSHLLLVLHICPAAFVATCLRDHVLCGVLSIPSALSLGFAIWCDITLG